MPKRDTKKAVLTALEPATMQVPAMDRPSLSLAWFMDSMRMEWDGPDHSVHMECTLCGAVVCDVEAADTLRVLFNTALAHGC